MTQNIVVQSVCHIFLRTDSLSWILIAWQVSDPELCVSLSNAVKRIYSLLGNALSTDHEVIVRTILEGSNFVWVGDGFVGIADCALMADGALKPHLHRVPEDLAEFRDLLHSLGVVETPTEVQYAKGLRNMFNQKKNEPLNVDELGLAINMARAASSVKKYQGIAYLIVETMKW